jgi:hypothetical protein
MKWMENNWKGMMGFLGLMLLISSASNLSVALTNQKKINAIRERQPGIQEPHRAALGLSQEGKPRAEGAASSRAVRYPGAIT